MTPAQYMIGNSGRNIIIGPSFVGWDTAISKRFAVTESQGLQFRAEMFNSLNHVNLGDPGTTVGTPAYGRIVSANDARQIQLGLKYIF